MTADTRSVFPEERLLLEILLDVEHDSYLEKSEWVVNGRYYIDGKAVSLSSALFKTADADEWRKGKRMRWAIMIIGSLMKILRPLLRQIREGHII